MLDIYADHENCVCYHDVNIFNTLGTFCPIGTIRIHPYSKLQVRLYGANIKSLLKGDLYYFSF